MLAVVVLVVPMVTIGSTFLEESQRYVIMLGDDHDSSSHDVYLEFYEIESEKNRQIIVDEGFVLFEDEEYEIIEDWKGSFLNDDKLFVMAGEVENFDEKIDVFLMGKFLRKTIEGSSYEITVKIHSDPEIEFQTEGEIMGIVPKEIPTETGFGGYLPIDLLFLIKDSGHRFQDQEYVFTTKLYDKKQNPLGQWDAKGGEISGAEIIIQAVDLQGNILREIKGITNEFGWFDGKFPIGSTFQRGEYVVLYTAKFQDNAIGSAKPLYVFEAETDANFRHFTPTSDIGEVTWSDGKGNDNGLMYDDLDEYSIPGPGIDDSDYIRSRGLGGTGGSSYDTVHLKMSTNAGVTPDHAHIISYTLSKNLAGGNEIKVTVILFEGSQQIAQWTYLNVDENFIQITNVLTQDQKKTILDYDNLSLEFMAECTLCDEDAPSKRRAQISWVHMIV